MISLHQRRPLHVKGEIEAVIEGRVKWHQHQCSNDVRGHASSSLWLENSSKILQHPRKLVNISDVCETR